MSVRNVTYSTTGVLERNSIIPVEGGYEVDLLVDTGQDCSVCISIHPTLVPQSTAQPFSISLRESVQRWKAWFDLVPPVDDLYLNTYAEAW
jgi:predicted Zn-dependent protease